MSYFHQAQEVIKLQTGYFTMLVFAYNMNLPACISFPSPESYIYVKKPQCPLIFMVLRALLKRVQLPFIEFTGWPCLLCVSLCMFNRQLMMAIIIHLLSQRL